MVITISNNGIAAHRSHQHGEDVIPAVSATLCVGQGNGGSSPQPGGQPAAASSAGKSTICHATGSESNPFVVITISNNGIPAHRSHQHGEDVIPATSLTVCEGSRTVGQTPPPGEEGDQPTGEAGSLTPPAEPAGAVESDQAQGGGSGALGAGSDQGETSAPAGGEGGVQGLRTALEQSREPADGEVAGLRYGAGRQQGAVPGQKVAGREAPSGSERSDSELASTGLSLAMFLLLGSGMLIAGAALWRAVRQRG